MPGKKRLVQQASTKLCKEKNKRGKPCQAPAMEGSEYCYHHNPQVEVERRAAKSKGGRARHGRELTTTGHVPKSGEQQGEITLERISRLLSSALSDTETLEKSNSKSRTIGALARVGLEVVDRKDFGDRIKAMEDLLGINGTGVGIATRMEEVEHLALEVALSRHLGISRPEARLWLEGLPRLLAYIAQFNADTSKLIEALMMQFERRVSRRNEWHD